MRSKSSQRFSGAFPGLAKASPKLAPGVGVSISNIHWWFLGTAERIQETTGRAVGRIAAVFTDVVARAFDSSQSAAMRAARTEIEKVIKQDAEKKA